MKDRVLVDTSAWIAYFRQGEGKLCDSIDILLDNNLVVICGIIEMELLQGVRDKERKLIKDLFSALPYVALQRDDFIRSGERLNSLRIKGITIPSTDALIGILCIRYNLSLLTLDKHFDFLTDIKRFQIAK